MITGRITRVDGIKATATFYNRFQPYLIENGKATSSPRINSYVKTGIGLDTVICQIVGEHEVLFCGPDEVIEIKHTAYSKAIFGKGAIQAAQFLKGKKPGMYQMSDVIG